MRMRFTKKESGDVSDLICALKAENERLREMLREVIDGAWEMDFEDRHTINSEIIGKVAAYLVALSLHEGQSRDR